MLITSTPIATPESIAGHTKFAFGFHCGKKSTIGGPYHPIISLYGLFQFPLIECEVSPKPSAKYCPNNT